MPAVTRRSMTLLWALLYVMGGYASLRLDDPQTEVAFVWLPAGIAAAAFLIAEQRTWPALFAAFLALDLALAVAHGHPPARALWVGLVSLCTSMLIAVGARAYARERDALRAIFGWIAATLLASAAGAVVTSAGLAAVEVGEFQELAWIWWAANVTGVLFGVPILMGFAGFRSLGAPGARLGMAAAIVAGIAAAAVAWQVFGMADLHALPAPVTMGLACVPVALVTVVTLLGGNRPGSLAILAVGAIALYRSDLGLGPFFAPGMREGEPLILAQAYLVAIALLQVFIRVVTHSVARLDGRDSAGGQPERLYRLDLGTGAIVWDGDDAPRAAPAPATRDEMLARAHPDDRAALERRLRADGGAARDGRPMRLRIADDACRWRVMLDHSRGVMQSEDTTFLIGSWRQASQS
ncbi:MASE1 domain-containing protein [Bordetella bronchiseptica]|uniref:MASE1 domain-containing protein n=1 Tax=Bordetella bronchiseptica TaxID=518 RepID=UPI000B100EE3|nr:MASE1 domain-containing protein [Bordetella bronchiseptica]